MAYTLSDRWSVDGTTGSLIIPELWLPELENDLPMFNFWNQFMVKSVDTIKGKGKTFNVSYVQDRAANTTPLTAGTPIPRTNSTGLGQSSVTVAQYGHLEPIEELDDFLSNSDVAAVAAVQIARGAMTDRNALIGAKLMSGANYFTIEGVTAAGVVETSGTTANGISPILPAHVRAIKGILNRKGIAPYADGFYRWVGAPGLFDSIKASGEVYESAAQLGIKGLFAMGEVTKFGGFIFIEEAGARAVSTYGTNAHSVIMGGNPLVGWDNFLRPDLVKYYADSEQDFGRSGKIGYIGLWGASLLVDAPTNARTWSVYSGV